MKKERTLALIKPGNDEYITSILGRIDSNPNLRLVAATVDLLTSEDVEELYSEHVEKPFFKDHSEYMQSDDVLALLLEGEDAIKTWRAMMGATDPTKAEPGTIRGDYGKELPRNVVHGSDSPEAAQREIQFFFKNIIF